MQILAWVLDRGVLCQQEYSGLQFTAALLTPITPAFDGSGAGGGAAPAPTGSEPDGPKAAPATAAAAAKAGQQTGRGGRRQADVAGGPLKLFVTWLAKLVLICVVVYTLSLDPPVPLKSFAMGGSRPGMDRGLGRQGRAQLPASCPPPPVVMGLYGLLSSIMDGPGALITALIGLKARQAPAAGAAQAACAPAHARVPGCSPPLTAGWPLLLARHPCAVLLPQVSPHFDCPWLANSISSLWSKVLGSAAASSPPLHPCMRRRHRGMGPGATCVAPALRPPSRSLPSSRVQRWDLAAGNALRSLVFEPACEGRLVFDAAAPQGPKPSPVHTARAILLTFLASGIVHEYIFWWAGAAEAALRGARSGGSPAALLDR